MLAVIPPPRTRPSASRDNAGGRSVRPHTMHAPPGWLLGGCEGWPADVPKTSLVTGASAALLSVPRPQLSSIVCRVANSSSLSDVETYRLLTEAPPDQTCMF